MACCMGRRWVLAFIVFNVLTVVASLAVFALFGFHFRNQSVAAWAFVSVSVYSMSTVNLNVLKTAQGGLKVGCLILGSVCLGLFVNEPVSNSKHFDRLCIGVFIGYLIVTGGYLIGYMTGVKTRYQETIHNCFGALLYLIIGAILIHNSSNRGDGRTKNFGIAEGVFALVNCLIYAIDTCFAYRN
ncbi:unnamed protein product [Cyprideis torosa]|uniref:Uncharacterized protein n=1 Tax=Cyprideis torosa TaxID=163714 RepID=A0A7R8WEZ1_9CRUS|nr:unnamed protein product [Cyprideis torosa]CAG0896223.1 unnamed protein product [Cyprideis torosa]